jgi:hypothetical protein
MMGKEAVAASMRNDDRRSGQDGDGQSRHVRL